MLASELHKKALDRVIILPAFVFIVQSLPWLMARFRLRATVPFMLLYFVISIKRRDYSRTSGLERRVAIRMLISFVVYAAAYIYIDWRFYDKFQNQVFVPLILGLFNMWVFTTLVCANKVREIKVLTLVLFWTLLLGAYHGMSYLADESNQNIVRAMTGGAGGLEETASAISAGVGGYGFVYSIGLLIPAGAYAAFRAKGTVIRCLFLVGSLVFTITTYLAGFSILMFACLAGSLLYLLSSAFRKYSLFRWIPWGVVILLLILTLSPQIIAFMVEPIDKLAEITVNANYSRRLTAIADAVAGRDSYSTHRTGLMWQSWNAFLEYPFFGIPQGSRNLLGGHSYIFDYLAKGGIFYFTVLPLFLYQYKKYLNVVIYSLSVTSKFLIEIYFVMVVIVCILNPLSSAIVYANLFFMLPGLSLFFRDSLLNNPNNRPELRNGYRLAPDRSFRQR